MKASLSSLNRAMGLGLAALSLTSCSLFRDGKYASQWEIQSDVPASLNNGEATPPPASSTANTAQVKSNLSSIEDPAMLDSNVLDLPGTGSESLIDVPKPDLSIASISPEQSPVELLNVPGAPEAPYAPVTTLTNADLGNLLPPGPPPAVTEEELAMAPSALPAAAGSGNVPGEAGSLPPADSIPPAPPAPGNPDPASPADAATGDAKAPVKTASAGPTIPLLYGQLDLSPYLPPVVTANEAPAPPPGE